MLPSPEQYAAMLDGAAAGGWGVEAEASMARRVAQACELLGSAGRSIAGQARPRSAWRRLCPPNR